MINKLLNIKDKKVLIIGDIILDHYVNVVPTKISTEYPGIIVNYEDDYYSLGGAANVASNISKYGVDVTLFGIIGSDYDSKIVLNLLKKEKINIDHILNINNYKTIVKERIISCDNKQLLRIDYENNIIDNYDQILDDFFKLMNNQYDLIVISDYRKGLITNKLFDLIIDFSKDNNIKVICDPKDKKINYHDLFILKPNKKEFNEIVGNESDVKYYMKKNNIDNIVLTLGNNGIKLYSNYVKIFPAIKSEIYDVTGAGDVVLSYLALGYLCNYEMKFICDLANKAASVKVNKFGVYNVNFLDIYKFYNSKILDNLSLKTICSMIKQNNKSIVFTNGCFDILHSGHLFLLKEAKKKGDILIVGLNSDSSIKRLKGNNRPIINESERLEMLSSLEFVDYVILFDEDTPLNLIKIIKPNILVKGSDYKDKYVIGTNEVLKYGGSLELVNIKKNKSTTNIINKIKNGDNI